jgi:hypothetical protein
LSEEREAKLNSIGFVWNIRRCHARQFSVKQVDWNVRFRELLAYKLAAGDCDVPQNFGPNPQLGRWVRTQRLAKKNLTLTKERWEKLKSTGFVWGKYRSSGCMNTSNQQIQDENKIPHGLCDVPERRSGNNPPHLHKLTTARRLNNRQKEVLEKQSVADLTTSDSENFWDAHFQELLSYLQTNGNFKATQRYPFNPLLARWVSEQRDDYDLKCCGRQTPLTPLREAKLDAIGFSWFVRRPTIEDAPVEGVSSASVRPEEATSGNKVSSENVGVATNPDHITSR